ncbi:HlyD family secretion protein [Tahibacter amnicola]|uniref:Efflux RND transporter periplasmic adaptor subunit n=1 Tax=Tahibacter amnicola TaxID=2976241 RepID=A0ABY6BG72_9GAMM|nr:efflux RND transporter periplasmic adaptor subunit [Tahibacter amnicola]UXI68512.1 efflux RND transporter periplasmic adaptor subunit [Tahibacter amnicola]
MKPVFRILPWAALCLAVLSACGKPPSARAPAVSDTIAAGGLVEPAGEERVIIPQLSGRLSRVFITEGDRVTAGQLIAEIENSEFRAALDTASANLALREAELAKLEAGARTEELAAAEASRQEAAAAEQQAVAERDRREAMAAQKLIAAEALQQARAQAQVATARRARADAELALLRAGARKEDIAAARSAVSAASAERDRAKALYDKSQIHSPIDGQVLKRDLREGETVVALSPLPLARIGDLSRLFVRADVDELDIGRIREGQKAAITSDAFPGQSFAGEVVRVSRRMGRRNSISGDPAEKQDAKILEALISLDGTPPLPVGLRVDVRIAAPKS